MVRLFTPQLSDLLSELDRSSATWIRVAAAELERSFSERGGQPHRFYALPLCAARGLSNAETDTVTGVLDGLQILFDFTDNLADADEDERAGVDHLGAYAEIPPAAVPALGPLLCSALLVKLAARFPPPRRGAEAAERIVRVLGRMCAGQAEPPGSLRHELGTAGHQALLLALPLWVSLCPDDGPMLTAVEGWATRFGILWARSHRCLDEPESIVARYNRAGAERELRAAWPDACPFRPGESLGADRLLGSMLRT